MDCNGTPGLRRAVWTMFLLAALCIVWGCDRSNVAPDQATFPLDLMAADPTPGVVAAGLGNLDVVDGLGERWLTGPETTLRFRVDQARPLRLVFRYTSPLPGQTVTVLINGAQAGVFPPDPAAGRQLAFMAKSGENTVTLRFALWNHGQTTIAPADPRKLAGLFRELSVEP